MIRTFFNKHVVIVALVFSYTFTALFSFTIPQLKVFSIGCMLFAGAYHIVGAVRRSTRAFYSLILINALVVVPSISWIYATSAHSKLYNFVLIILFFGILPYFCFLKNTVVEHLPFSLLLLGVCSLVAFILLPQQHAYDRITLSENNPIWVARAVGLVGVGAASLILRDFKPSILCYVAIVLSMAGIFFTGSRGPLLALSVAIILSVIFSSHENKIRHIIILLIFFGLSILFVLSVAGISESRILKIEGLESGSVGERFRLLVATAHIITAYPQGIGLGNFWYGGVNAYPHNIFMEFLLEFGVFFGSIWILFIVLGVVGIFLYRARHDVFKVLIVYELVNALVSGNMTTPRFLYGLAFLGNYFLLDALRRVYYTDNKLRV